MEAQGGEEVQEQRCVISVNKIIIIDRKLRIPKQKSEPTNQPNTTLRITPQVKGVLR